jgi:hypothetical protein
MRTIVTFLALVFCMTLSAQKGVVSKWLDNPSADLKIPESDYLSTKKGKVLYAVTNDDNNIYLDMKVSDVPEQNRILKMGLTVWVDTEGKSRKEVGIKYPIGTQFNRQRNANVINPPSPLAQANTIQLIGFKNTEETRFPSDNTDNIRGSVKYDNDGNLVYNLCIPLNKLQVEKTVDAGQLPLTLGIEYGAPPAMPGQARPMTSMAPQGVGGRGGGRSSGRGGSRGGMNSGGMSNAPAPSSGAPPPVMIWMKNINLATK